MREIREVKTPPGKIKVRGTDGRVVPIRIRRLTEAQKRLTIQALDRIESCLERCDDIDGVDETFRKAVAEGGQHAGFVTTGSSDLVSFLIPQPPVVVLNRDLFGADSDRLCTLVLYELLHLVQGNGPDVVRSSPQEAKRHMMCYALLGLDIPLDHWAFKTYPALLSEMTDSEANANE